MELSIGLDEFRLLWNTVVCKQKYKKLNELDMISFKSQLLLPSKACCSVSIFAFIHHDIYINDFSEASLIIYLSVEHLPLNSKYLDSLPKLLNFYI